jgi:RNA 3'-terminal phosphate cyclase (ATP)
VFVEIESEHVTEIFTGFGRIGTSAENVAKEVLRHTRDYLATDIPVGSYLADQILLPLGISAWQTGSKHHGGSFRTLPLTRHSTTHIEILQRFLDIGIDVEPRENGSIVSVKPVDGDESPLLW